MSRRYLWLAATFLWCGFIFYQSQKSGLESGWSSHFFVEKINSFLSNFFENVSVTELVIRKIAHFLEYFILGVLVFRSFFNRRELKRSFWLSVAAGVVYAVSDEFHQYFIPGRAASPIDVLIDSSGLFLAVLISYIIARARWKKTQYFFLEYLF